MSANPRIHGITPPTAAKPTGIDIPIQALPNTNPDGTCNGTARMAVTEGGVPANAIDYRAAVGSADLADGSLLLTSGGVADAGAGGSLSGATYYFQLIGYNKYGRAASSIQNKAITASHAASFTPAVGQITNYTAFDVFLSTDVGAPKWVATVLLADVQAGVKVTAVGTTTPNLSTPGQIIVNVAGTGWQPGTTIPQSTAYVFPALVDAPPVDCTGYQYIDFDLNFNPTFGSSTAPALIVMPFFYDNAGDDGGWYAGAKQTLTFGGASNVYESLRQRVRVEARGNSKVHLLVVSIAGGTVDMRATLS